MSNLRLVFVAAAAGTIGVMIRQVVAPQGRGAASRDTTRCEVIHGEGMTGKEVGDPHGVHDASACVSRCADTHDCWYAAWDRPEGGGAFRCKFYDRKYAALSGRAGAVTASCIARCWPPGAPMATPATCRIEQEDGWYAGAFADSMIQNDAEDLAGDSVSPRVCRGKAATAAACAAKCDAHAECVSFNFVHEGEGCHLFRRRAEQDMRVGEAAHSTGHCKLGGDPRSVEAVQSGPPLPPGVKMEGVCRAYEGTAYEGRLINTHHVQDGAGCARQCRDDSGCGYAKYVPGDAQGVCSIFALKQEERKEGVKKGVVSYDCAWMCSDGPVQEEHALPKGCSMEKDVWYEGGAIGDLTKQIHDREEGMSSSCSSRTATPEGCAARCKANPRCKSFNYRVADNACHRFIQRTNRHDGGDGPGHYTALLALMVPADGVLLSGRRTQLAIACAGVGCLWRWARLNKVRTARGRGAAALSDLHGDVFTVVLPYLDVGDLVELSYVNRFFYAQCADDELWEALCFEVFADMKEKGLRSPGQEHMSCRDIFKQSLEMSQLPMMNFAKSVEREKGGGAAIAARWSLDGAAFQFKVSCGSSGKNGKATSAWSVKRAQQAAAAVKSSVSGVNNDRFSNAHKRCYAAASAFYEKARLTWLFTGLAFRLIWDMHRRLIAKIWARYRLFPILGVANVGTARLYDTLDHTSASISDTLATSALAMTGLHKAPLLTQLARALRRHRMLFVVLVVVGGLLRPRSVKTVRSGGERPDVGVTARHIAGEVLTEAVTLPLVENRDVEYVLGSRRRVVEAVCACCALHLRKKVKAPERKYVWGLLAFLLLRAATPLHWPAARLLVKVCTFGAVEPLAPLLRNRGQRAALTYLVLPLYISAMLPKVLIWKATRNNHPMNALGSSVDPVPWHWVEGLLHYLIHVNAAAVGAFDGMEVAVAFRLTAHAVLAAAGTLLGRGLSYRDLFRGQRW